MSDTSGLKRSSSEADASFVNQSRKNLLGSGTSSGAWLSVSAFVMVPIGPVHPSSVSGGPDAAE